MRSFIVLAAGAALVAAKKNAAPSDGGEAPRSSGGASSGGANASFLTGSSVVNHFYDSGRLLKAIVSHGSGTLANAAYDMIPPPQQELVNKTYTDVTKQIEKLRKDNGLPSYAEVSNQLSDMVTLASNAVTKGLNEAQTALVPVAALASAFIASFEAANPELAGMLPRDIIDLMVVILYLSILFFYVVWPLFTSVCCCCCSGGSKKETVTPRKPNGKAETQKMGAKKKN